MRARPHGHALAPLYQPKITMAVSSIHTTDTSTVGTHRIMLALPRPNHLGHCNTKKDGSTRAAVLSTAKCHIMILSPTKSVVETVHRLSINLFQRRDIMLNRKAATLNPVASNTPTSSALLTATVGEILGGIFRARVVIRRC